MSYDSRMMIRMTKFGQLRCDFRATFRISNRTIGMINCGVICITPKPFVWRSRTNSLYDKLGISYIPKVIRNVILRNVILIRPIIIILISWFLTFLKVVFFKIEINGPIRGDLYQNIRLLLYIRFEQIRRQDFVYQF